MIKKKYLLLFLFFLSVTAIFFRKSFSVFFFQDDYFLFSISRIEKLSDLFRIFIPRTDAIYYRPISLQLFYYFFYQLFKFNIFYYHAFQALLHALNGLLVFIFIEKLFKKRGVALIAAFFFTVSWTHIYELTWVASTFNSIALFFVLLYFICLHNFPSKKNYFPEIFLVLSLFSIEIAVILPALSIIILFYLKKLRKFNLLRIALHFAIAGLYLFFRFILFKIPAHNSYQIGISFQTVKNIAMFILWLFNFPEASIVHLKWSPYLLTIVDAWFAETFPWYAIFLTVSLIFWIFFFLIFFLLHRLKDLKACFVFGAAWFMIAAIPVLAIPKRSYPYYPLIAQIGFWIVLAQVILHMKFRLLSAVAMIIFISGSWLTMQFNNQNHWVHMSSFHAKNYYEKYLKVNAVLKDKPYVFWQIDDLFARNSLVDGLAFNVFSGNYQQKYYLERSAIPDDKSLLTFDLHKYLTKQSLLRQHRFFELKIATPAAALDLWY